MVNSDIANGLVKEIQVLDDKEEAYFEMDGKILKAKEGKIIIDREDNPDNNNPDNNDLDMDHK